MGCSGSIQPLSRALALMTIDFSAGTAADLAPGNENDGMKLLEQKASHTAAARAQMNVGQQGILFVR